MKKGLHCPKCKTYLNLPKQIKDLDVTFGDDVELGAEFPWTSAIRCEKCNDTVAFMLIKPAGEIRVTTVAREDELNWN